VLFNSLEFLLFLPCVFALYHALPARLRWALLLLASYVFYMAWRPEYAALIASSTLVDYYAALRLERLTRLAHKRALLGLSLAVNLGLLFTFKYFNFFSTTVAEALDAAGLSIDSPALDLLLPVGISFYTFQTLGYTIDVYRGQVKAERHLGYFALYVSFWPQLVAGPIERAAHLIPMLRAPRTPTHDDLVAGARLILWGFFKKMVIADRVALYVEEVFDKPHLYSGAPVALATALFAVEILCDFSGYCDIAVGCARLLGVDLMENFRRPYLATSMRDFWSRWHISLSTWFRDYVYIPLGGNRVGRARWFSNLFITFVVSGLWHGANLTFLLWGAIHGACLILGITLAPIRAGLVQRLALHRFPRALHAAAVLFTFSIVCLAWIPFRARSIDDALQLYQALIPRGGGSPLLVDIPSCATELAIAALAIAALIVVHLLQERGRLAPLVARIPAFLTPGLEYVAALTILLFGKLQGQQFIYFQF
jgi:D-alanyl-lipoteichoic acid acyltransferase DltB (MBOAT superfamily)